MGGDLAPAPIVDGAVSAARHFDVEVVLVGATAAIESALATHADWRDLPIQIAEAPDVIGMAEPL
jgi:phosphate acyltransferase